MKKTILATIWCVCTMLICGVDTELTPMKNILILVAVWFIDSILLYYTLIKEKKENEIKQNNKRYGKTK